VGVPFVTAVNTFERARLRPGDWVIVTGAAGAVGFAAIELAHASGARVIAEVKNDAQRARLNMEKLAAVATSAAGDLQAVVKETTGGRGADIALNGLGAGALPGLCASLAEEGRVAVYSILYAGKDASMDLLQLCRRRLELIGINNSALTLAQNAATLSNLQPLFENGKLAPPRIGAQYPISEGVAAYAAVRPGVGKVVLVF
jgi:NADPH:quinone reductase